MLKKKALKKIFITTLTMFIILVVYTVPFVNKKNNHVLRTNLEIKDISNLDTESIYLLNDKGYLVRVEVFINSVDINDKISKIISYLTIDNKQIPVSLNGYIPIDVKLISFNLENGHLYLNFSKELLNKDDKDKIITGIVYSFLEQNNILDVSILIEDKELDQYKNINKDIGINKEYLFTSRKDIQKVIVYYMDETNTYYVPVTKYLNDTRDKIEIIVEELSKVHSNLISLENIHTKLLDYREVENVLFLNFNEAFIDSDIVSMEKIYETMALSIFDNYDVNMVAIEVNHKNVRNISRDSL